MTAAHLSFRAMSTEVGITVVDGDEGSLHWAQERVAELERRWSRFLPDSEINRLNRAGGEPVEVSHDTVVAVRAACAAWVHTEGCFDPTVHDSLLRLGYDDSIDVVRDARREPVQPMVGAPGCAGVVYDEAAGVVQFPAGVHFDLGGIGKGLAADVTASGLIERGASGALVNIGGDVRVIGKPANGIVWRVDIEDPRTERTLITVDLLDGGVATSTTLRRRWRLAERAVHHIVVPSDGAPTESPVVGASVVAGTAAWADALSKVPFVAPDRIDLLAPSSAVVMRSDGSTSLIGPADRFGPIAA
ncbi:MAG: thiamine biosynthesis lipoprotein [Acidimicrobiaceae bacterium]|nr:MAG: thiamine biosynthesis lipoprotein [Acidimicrobiaceae bacterium]